MTTPPRTVGDIATLVRSKNAGPFWLTIDILCDNEADYDSIAQPDVITPTRIAELYRVDPA